MPTASADSGRKGGRFTEPERRDGFRDMLSSDSSKKPFPKTRLTRSLLGTLHDGPAPKVGSKRGRDGDSDEEMEKENPRFRGDDSDED